MRQTMNDAEKAANIAHLFVPERYRPTAIRYIADVLARHRSEVIGSKDDLGGFYACLDNVRELMEEAKGVEGPDGGTVTNHLDAAEYWLNRAVAAINARRVDAESDAP